MRSPDARWRHDLDRLAAEPPAVCIQSPDLGQDGIARPEHQADHLAPSVRVDVGHHGLQDRGVGQDHHARLVGDRGDGGRLRGPRDRRHQEEGQEGGRQEHRSSEHTCSLWHHRQMAMGSVLWTPPPDVRERSRIGAYLSWLEQERGLSFDGL